MLGLLKSLIAKHGGSRRPRAARPDADVLLESTVIDELRPILDVAATIPMVNLARCVDHFRKPTTVLAQFRTAQGHLSVVPDLSRTRGLDLACWCGFMTWMMKRLGAAEVWGSDVIEEHVEAAARWSQSCSIEGLRFRANAMDSLPYDPGYFDWVVTSGLYSNLNPQATIGVFADVHRVLKPDGQLLFNDGGNILHPPTRERIAARYREVEIGDGTPETPRGDFTSARADIIRRCDAGLDEPRVLELARDTCYLWKPEIEQAVAASVSGQTLTVSRFDPDDIDRPPVDPDNGNAAARANDPWRIRGELEAAGFSVVFSRYAGTPGWSEAEAQAELGSGPGVFIVARKRAGRAT